jgi:hypothetical protein
LKKRTKKLLLLRRAHDRGHRAASSRHKSLFASFSSEEEDSFLKEKKSFVYFGVRLSHANGACVS